jgi:hypothetical protein
MTDKEGTCDETPFEGLGFPLSIRNWHFVKELAQKSFLWGSEYRKTVGTCRQRKFSFRPLLQSKSLTFPYRDFSEYACGLANDIP